MTARRYRLELRQNLGQWRARLLALPGPAPSPDPIPELPEWVEFDTPLALLEWLERDLAPDATPRGLP